MIQHFASWLDWREAPRQLVQLAFPAECAMCQAPVGTRCRLCSACHADLVSQRYCCNRCASPLAEVLPNEHCIHCQQAGWRLARVVALGHYQGKLRRAVILCKKARCENLRYALANELADRLRQRLAGLDGPPPILLPVPNHWTRIFSRAANTTLSLASHLARRTGWPVLSDAVRRIRRTRKQGCCRGRKTAKCASCLPGHHPSTISGKACYPSRRRADQRRRPMNLPNNSLELG